jgi:uncharacterized membrane protein YccC
MNWSQFEGLAAIRCTAGVAIVLVAGLAAGQPAVSAFGAIGAVSVGFGSFQGAYRSRAAVMLWAAVCMALSIAVGSLAGASHLGSIATATLVAFGSGLLVALGPSASFVGLQCVVAVLIATGFPADLRGALLRGAIVFGGGLVQTLLVVMIWPLRRFTAERRAIAAAYRSLAAYAAQIPSADATAPEPHTFAATLAPTHDPQPFARAAEVLVFQTLLDEAERIRASLAAFATQQRRLAAASPACARSLAEQCGRALAEIADALESGREARESTPIWERIESCAREVGPSPAVDTLLGQIRAAWRIAGVMTDDGKPERAVRYAPLRPRPPVGDSLTTLAANLTLRSAALRHALRLAATIAIGTAVYRYVHLDRGYWLPMTSLLVLRPEYHETLARGLARVGGTILGAAIATAIVHLLAPSAGTLTLLVLVFAWGCYALFRINYALFTVCLTGYVVFILMLSGVAEMTAASLRAVYTIEGGALALIVYAVWPTWASQTARSSLAAMLDAHGAYVDALLAAHADPRLTDLRRLTQLRTDARLVRSNTEAVIERMLAEPASRAALPPRVALGLLAALRRHALGALALHAGLERGVSAPVGGMALLKDQMTWSLKALADAVRAGTPPPSLPPLRQTQLALTPAADTLVVDETDLMVDSINTMAELLSGASHRER